MTRRIVPLLLLGVFACPSAILAEDDGPSKDVPELKVLANFVGTWDVAAGSKDAPATKGRFTAKWTLDGRFVQGTGFIKTEGASSSVKVTTLMTYDPIKKTYRTWAFMSNGHTSESEGTWDAKTRTMTRITRYGDVTQTTTSIFAENGIEKWTMVATDKAKKIVGEMRGTNTRRKDW